MNRFLNILTSALLAIALFSCQSFDEPSPEPGTGSTAEYAFSIYLNAGDGIGSRAPQGDYDPGSGYENYIDIIGGDFRVALYAADNTWLATIADAKVIPLDENYESAKRYLLQCDLKPELAATINSLKSIKLVMLANWRGNYPALDAGLTLDGLFDAAPTMAYTGGLPGPVLGKADKIAMYGVSQFDKITLESNIVKNLGTLHLLRALAKIEIWDSEATLMKMTEVRLTRHKTAATPLPRGVVHQSEYVKDSYDEDYVPYPSFPKTWGAFDNEVSEPLKIEPAADGRYYVYVPEFLNTNRALDEQKARLEVYYEGNGTYYIDFKDNKGRQMDILRNYWYKFQVSKKADIDSEPTCVIELVPYTGIWLNPDFGIDRD